MDYTVDRALIYSILKGGVPAFQQAKELGVDATHLKFEDQQIFRLCEDVFLPLGKLPTLTDLRVLHGIELPEATDEFDVGLCSKDIVKRGLATALNEGLGPIAEMVWTDPYGARDKINELIQKTNWSTGQLVRTSSPAVIEEIKKRYLEAKGRTGSLLGFSSPWPSRDKKSLGLQRGEVTVLLAKRKTGKSWFAFKWAEHIWTAKQTDGTPELKPGECMLIVTMEMPVWQVLRRFFAINQRLNYEEFRAGRLTKTEEDKYFAWCEEMKKPSIARPDVIVVGSDRVRTVRDIISLCAQYRPKVVFIDGFYILNTAEKGGKSMPMWERVETVIKDIKLELAVKMDIPIVATTQLSGQVKRGDLNAEADAVAYAKSIGNYADSIDGLFGNDKFRDSRKRILRGMEARDFETVDLEINFDPGAQNYSEIKVLDKSDDGSGNEDEDDDDPGDPGAAPSYTDAEITLD